MVRPHRQWLTPKLLVTAMVAMVYFAMVATATHSLQMGGRGWVAAFLDTSYLVYPRSISTMAQFTAPVAPNSGVNGPHRHILVEPDRGPLRIIAIGAPPYVREAITQMHMGTYQVDMDFWTPFLAIPDTGLVIPHYPGQIFALLQRPQHLNPRNNPTP